MSYLSRKSHPPRSALSFGFWLSPTALQMSARRALSEPLSRLAIALGGTRFQAARKSLWWLPQCPSPCECSCLWIIPLYYGCRHKVKDQSITKRRAIGFSRIVSGAPFPGILCWLLFHFAPSAERK